MFEKIKYEICRGENVSPDEVFNETRKREVIFARQAIMYFCEEFEIASQKHIGKLCGGKDHATVFHAKKAINNLIDTNKNIKQKIEQYREELMRIKTVIHVIRDIKTEIDQLKTDAANIEMRLININLAIANLEQLDSVKKEPEPISEPLTKSEKIDVAIKSVGAKFEYQYIRPMSGYIPHQVK